MYAVREGEGHRLQEGVQRVLDNQVPEDVLHVVQDQVHHRLQEDLQGLLREEGQMVGSDLLKKFITILYPVLCQ